MQTLNRPLILSVEDDPTILKLITTMLKTNHYSCLCAGDAESALSLAVSKKPDIFLIDLGLPDMDGVEMIKSLREWTNKPILVVSARGEDTDKISALDAGADDYITKPFSVDELLARIRVAQRRLSQSYTDEGNPVFQNGSLTINYLIRTASLDGKELHLTPTEYKLLCLLAKNLGKVLTHTYMTEKIWGSSWDNDVASLRVHMASLRKKIEHGGRKYIQTHIGVGYRMIKAEE